MVLSIIFLEDKHKIVEHLSIFYEYQHFFQHRICFSIQSPDYSDPWPRLAHLSSFLLIRLFNNNIYLSVLLSYFLYFWSLKCTIYLHFFFFFFFSPHFLINTHVYLLVSWIIHRSFSVGSQFELISQSCKELSIFILRWLTSVHISNNFIFRIRNGFNRNRYYEFNIVRKLFRSDYVMVQNTTNFHRAV